MSSGRLGVRRQEEYCRLGSQGSPHLGHHLPGFHDSRSRTRRKFSMGILGDRHHSHIFFICSIFVTIILRYYCYFLVEPNLYIKLYPKHAGLSPVRRIRHAQGTLGWMSMSGRVCVRSLPASLPTRFHHHQAPGHVLCSSFMVDPKAAFPLPLLFLDSVRKGETSSQWYNE